MNLHIKVDHHPHCIWFLNLDSISLPQISSSLSATLQFLTVPLKHQDPEANAMFQAQEEARSLISVATEILYMCQVTENSTQNGRRQFSGVAELKGLEVELVSFRMESRTWFPPSVL